MLFDENDPELALLDDTVTLKYKMAHRSQNQKP